MSVRFNGHRCVEAFDCEQQIVETGEVHPHVVL